MTKINLEPYKGVRDFYPEDKAVQNYIFSVWQKTAESFGYEEYAASILEPLELYKAKSSEEIMSDQVYAFLDRGKREVVLRPEMTPTVARMIAARWQEIPAPVRWYSIGNFFRYEKPQKGRRREFWQLNCDLFGGVEEEADIEIISVCFSLMKNFGAKESDFEIRINNREIFNYIYEKIGIPKEKQQIVSRIIDKKNEIPAEKFEQYLGEIMNKGMVNKLSYILNSGDGFFEEFGDNEAVSRLRQTMERITNLGINNVFFSPTLARGFDYYTGMIFEIFDLKPENTRSLFGGGRYDNLVFDLAEKKVPAVGFAMGDVTVEDFLISRDLIPKTNPTVKLWLSKAPETKAEELTKIAAIFREAGINTGIDISEKKLAEQLKLLEKRGVQFVIVIGKDEITTGKFKIRNVETREEKSGTVEEIIATIKAS